MCARKVSHKTDIFCTLCKKHKKMSREMDYFSTKICLIYTGHKTCRFLLKQLREHVTCQDIHDTFFLYFFDIFKYVQNAFQIKGAYAPGCRNTLPVT